MASTRQPWFTFLIHPRSPRDLDRVASARFLRRYSSTEAEFLRKVRSLRPLVAGEIVFGVTSFRGELIAVPRLPAELSGGEAIRAIGEAAGLAASRGAKILGLGGLTSPATGGGHRLIRHLPHGVTLTNGNAYTAAVVCANVAEACGKLGLADPPRVAIVGCTGSVGIPTTHLLAALRLPLLLIGRNLQRLEQKFGEISNVEFSIDLRDLKTADVVVLLTSDPSALLSTAHVKPGSVVIDCAQPANIDEENFGAYESLGVSVCEGGIVRIPNYSCSADLGFSNPKDTFACLAETYLFARYGIAQHSTGAPSVDLAKRLWRLAERDGIAVRPLQGLVKPRIAAPVLEPAAVNVCTGTLGGKNDSCFGTTQSAATCVTPSGRSCW
jgi:fatty aldehyde-generating acyl-ACP reductase